MTSSPEFDRYAEDYDINLNQAISITGENKDYFARGRVNWLSRFLNERKKKVETVMDFGCGTGSTTPHLLDILKAESVLGLDISSRSIDVARRDYGSLRAQFMLFEHYEPAGTLDLVYTSNVFHHIAREERADSLKYIYRSLKQGGLLAFCEQNRWNPATHYVMSRCEFDRHAVMLSPLEARRRLIDAGFDILCIDFLFFFPRVLRWLRPLEPFISKLPLGAQYMILCRKP